MTTPLRTLALVCASLIAAPAMAQDDEPKLPEYALTLRPAGPPLPSFKYELVPARDLAKNNAALLWHRALHLYADARPAGQEFYQARDRFDPAFNKPLKDFPKEDVRTFLKPFASTFREMEAAARCDHCDWGTADRIVAEGIGFLIPDAQKMRELTFLLNLRTRLHAADGKVDAALRDVQTGFALARHAAQGPTLIQFLIGNAIAAQTTRELEQVMQVPGCPNLYWSLTALPRPLVDLKAGMAGELRLMEATIPLPKDVEKGPMTPDEALAALDRLWAGIVKLAEEERQFEVPEGRLGLAFYITMQHPAARKSLRAAGKTEAELDAMPPAQVVMLDSLVRFRNLRDEHFVWFQAPYAEAMQGMRASSARLKELKRSPPLDYLQTMLLLLLPAVDKVYAAEIRTERRIASLRAVEAVRLHAAKHDKLPAKLADVTEVPVPVDPATGQAFGYVVEGDRFTLNVPPPPGEPANQSNTWKYVVTVARLNGARSTTRSWNLTDMRRYSLLLALLAGPAFAQLPGGPPSDFAKAVAPFVDEHTLVVARADVSRVDLDTALKLAGAVLSDEVLGEDPGPAAATWVKEFTRRAGKDVFLTYGPGDFPHPPALITGLPVGDDARLEVARLLSRPYKVAGVTVDWAVIHGCLCVGTRDALATLKARRAVDRPDLAAALDAGADGVIQVAFALSAEAKKIHEQVAPTLPAELGGGGIQKVTRGMKWTALVIGPGPKMPARWVTECASPEAAHDLQKVEQRARQAAAAGLLRTGTGPGNPAAGPFDNARTTQEGTRLTTEWDLGTNLLAVVQHPSGLPAERLRSSNNLKQLMLALHNYHDAHGHFPTDVRDKDGKPLLSWRVQILPYIEQEGLYRQFKLDEPWDSDHNKKLTGQMPKVLRSPRQATALRDRTTYLAPLGKGLMWDEPKGLKISHIADGTSNTIALVEADDDRAVVWSKPEDITIDPRAPATGLLGHYGDGFQAAMADGSTRFFKKGVDPMNLWALFTRAGGEVVNIK